jgi:hypothetical protein
MMEVDHQRTYPPEYLQGRHQGGADGMLKLNRFHFSVPRSLGQCA